MRGHPGDRKIQWFSRSRSDAGETTGERSGADAREDAETRLLNAEAANFEAATRLTDAETAKVAGEVALLPLQAQQLEAQIAKEKAETSSIDFAQLRDQTLLLVFLLMVILTLALVLVNPTMLETLGTGGALGALLGFASSRYGKS